MAEKHSSLTQSKLRQALHYCKDTGVFTRAVTVGGRWIAGSVVGTKNSSGYIQIRVGGERHLAHRLAFLYVNGVWPIGEIDHIDGTKDNNAIGNLRDVNRSENMQNQVKAQTRTNGRLLGAHYQARSKRWLAQIVLDGKLTHIGSFATPEQAHQAYIEAKRAMHPTCTI